jgi:hypothetical protein
MAILITSNLWAGQIHTLHMIKVINVWTTFFGLTDPIHLECSLWTVLRLADILINYHHILAPIGIYSLY